MSEGYSEKNVLASYVHLHFGSNPEVARHLVASCRAYKENLRGGGQGTVECPSPLPQTPSPNPL